MQDSIFAIGSILLALFLLPAIEDEQKPPLITSFSTGGVLLIFALTYESLHLYKAAATTGITALLWFVLFGQRFIKDIREIEDD